MLYPAVAPMVEKIGSRYSLVIAAAKRARQIALTAERDEAPLSDKPVKIAIIEISNDYINVKSNPVEMSAVLEEAIRTRGMELEHGSMSYEKDGYDDETNDEGFEDSVAGSDEEDY